MYGIRAFASRLGINLADNSELCQKKDVIINLFQQLLQKLAAEV